MSLDKLMTAIAEQGWYVWDDFLTAQQVRELRETIPADWHKAKIGRNDDAHRDVERRSDKIQWLKADMGLPVMDYLERMEQIRLHVNREFFLGLFEYEAHFAKYEAGDFYEKHYDSFQGNTNRRLTTVFYLNENWTAENGGELKLYDNKDRLIDTLAPRAGRLIVFLSEDFPHEVCVSHAQRYSIAGWFRINGVTEDRLDIAR